MNNNNVSNIVETAKELCFCASKKTGEIVEISKLKIECIRIGTTINRLYQRLGRYTYDSVKSDYKNDDLVASLVDDIDEYLEVMTILRTRIELCKTDVTCDICGGKNSKDNYYCAKCGSRVKNEFSDEESVTLEDDFNEADFNDSEYAVEDIQTAE